MTWPQDRDVVIGDDAASSGPGVQFTLQGELETVTVQVSDIPARTFIRLEIGGPPAP